MTAVSHLKHTVPEGIIRCKAGSNSDASFHWGDNAPVTKSSPLFEPSPVSATAPTAARRRSCFRVKMDQSQHPSDQNAGASKKVHFHNHDRLEQTRVFSQADAPSSLKSKLSSDTGGTGDMMDTFQPNCDTRICTLNTTSSPPSPSQPVRLQNLELLPSGCKMKGTIAVLNLAFEKKVSVRFTFDDWKTVSDVSAWHYQSLFLSRTIVSDIFTFLIDAESPPLDTDGRLQICVCYQVLDEEFWDNNAGENYVIISNA
ncbi:hypothetical protein N7450_011696 [Penicillium hetheringtonii]|uniref:CBM21 domain-containing protein n=1 Tax=Penicillium hetheringtonii TaxID=911720 RepID=A0AAD6GNI4_9EURO|nr:hypothetical protein N7450_011696 [Penicillium hetheringtonii]